MADQQRDYAKLVARAWSDEAFKAKLLNDPAAALKEAGIDVPTGVTVTVVENTDTVFHLILPPPPEGELDEEALDKIAAGNDLGCGVPCPCACTCE